MTMRRRLLVPGFVGVVLLAAFPSSASAAPGCREFGQFMAGSAQAPGPFGQLVQERVPDFSEDVEGFQAAACEP